MPELAPPVVTVTSPLTPDSVVPVPTYTPPVVAPPTVLPVLITIDPVLAELTLLKVVIWTEPVITGELPERTEMRPPVKVSEVVPAERTICPPMPLWVGGVGGKYK